MTIATAAASLHRRGTHRRLADRDFFTSLASIFGDDGGDDGDDGDDGGQSGDSGHDSGSKSSTCEYPFFLAQDAVSSFVVDEMGSTACTLQRLMAGLTSSTRCRLSAVGRRPYYEIEKCNTSRVPDS